MAELLHVSTAEQNHPDLCSVSVFKTRLISQVMKKIPVWIPETQQEISNVHLKSCSFLISSLKHAKVFSDALILLVLTELYDLNSAAGWSCNCVWTDRLWSCSEMSGCHNKRHQSEIQVVGWIHVNLMFTLFETAVIGFMDTQWQNGDQNRFFVFYKTNIQVDEFMKCFSWNKWQEKSQVGQIVQCFYRFIAFKLHH